MFKASIVKKLCINLRICRWTPAVKAAVKLKEEVFWESNGQITGGQKGYSFNFCQSITKVWEEFKEVLEKILWLVSEKFWQTV